MEPVVVTAAPCSASNALYLSSPPLCRAADGPAASGASTDAPQSGFSAHYAHHARPSPHPPSVLPHPHPHAALAVPVTDAARHGPSSPTTTLAELLRSAHPAIFDAVRTTIVTQQAQFNEQLQALHGFARRMTAGHGHPAPSNPGPVPVPTPNATGMWPAGIPTAAAAGHILRSMVAGTAEAPMAAPGPDHGRCGSSEREGNSSGGGSTVTRQGAGDVTPVAPPLPTAAPLLPAPPPFPPPDDSVDGAGSSPLLHRPLARHTTVHSQLLAKIRAGYPPSAAPVSTAEASCGAPMSSSAPHDAAQSRLGSQWTTGWPGAGGSGDDGSGDGQRKSGSDEPGAAMDEPGGGPRCPNDGQRRSFDCKRKREAPGEGERGRDRSEESEARD